VTAFIDISNAYDRVWRDGLLFRLIQLGVRGRLRKTHRNLKQIKIIKHSKNTPKNTSLASQKHMKTHQKTIEIHQGHQNMHQKRIRKHIKNSSNCTTDTSKHSKIIKNTSQTHQKHIKNPSKTHQNTKTHHSHGWNTSVISIIDFLTLSPSIETVAEIGVIGAEGIVTETFEDI